MNFRIWSLYIILLTSLFLFADEYKPTFELIVKDEAFEVRHYPKMLVAKTESGNNNNSLFKKLAGYIFGGNKSKKQIPMTAPVFMKDRPGEYSMMFIMPSGHTLKTLPKPTSSKVKLESFYLGKVAVIRYSGFNPKEKRLQKFKELLKWTKKKGHKVIGQGFITAGYDSPWTFPWNRRNEVLVNIK
ncbi:heme-binding protein [Bacteriovoracales bacterium]|nr:heme-binding protein [Bacteriovoracales bacterium]